MEIKIQGDPRSDTSDPRSDTSDPRSDSSRVKTAVCTTRGSFLSYKVVYFVGLAVWLANIKQSSIYFKEHASASLPGRIYLASRRFKSVDHRSAKFCPWIVLARRNKDSQDKFSCDRTQ